MNIQIIKEKIYSRVGTTYIAIFFERLPQLIGFLYLLRYRLIYSNFVTGKSPNIWGKFYIKMYNPRKSSIQIGDNLWMVSDEKRSGLTLFCSCKLTTIADGKIVIGNNVALNGTVITSKKNIYIGDGTIIAPNVIIVDTDFHAVWPPEDRFKQVSSDLDKAVTIGNNVWIGMNSIILKGLSIGDNSVIGAGSVVNSSIPDNCIAAGNPAKVIKSLA